MITSDLNLLREKDPMTWEKYTDLIGETEDENGISIGISIESLYKPARLAWLQAVLQDAIQMKIDYTAQRIKHTWGYSIICDLDGIVAWVHASDKEYIGVGDSPAEALLKAYLEAIG